MKTRLRLTPLRIIEFVAVCFGLGLVAALIRLLPLGDTTKASLSADAMGGLGALFILRRVVKWREPPSTTKGDD